MRVSQVILSDDEVAAQIREDLVGHPAEWVEEKVKEALASRAARSQQVQQAYDQTIVGNVTPHTVASGNEGVSVTYSKPVED